MNRTLKRVLVNLKSMFLALVSGIIIGVAGAGFFHALVFANDSLKTFNWLFYLLPLAGLCIVFLYEKYGKNDGGVKQLLLAAEGKNSISFVSAPLVFSGSFLTHLCGASAGREGAALQLGGTISNSIGKLFKLDDEERKSMVLCGMSAGFSALFGTPLAAAVFAAEVAYAGKIECRLFLSCLISSLSAKLTASLLGVAAESFSVENIPQINADSVVKLLIVALICAIVSSVFCKLLKVTGMLYERYLNNKYIRVLVASVVIILITSILNTSDFMGSGMGMIVSAVEAGEAKALDFFWKMILTALAMKAGFKGGEIVPSFSIGASLGCVLGTCLGIAPSISAAVGMIAVFCGVTNAPIASALIAFELFGFGGAWFYIIAVIVSFLFSGKRSLYK